MGEEERIGMLNLCMGQILRKFHEEHGHGPDTRQLLEMRHALAGKLGVEVPDLPTEEMDDGAATVENETEDDTLVLSSSPNHDDNDISLEANKRKSSSTPQDNNEDTPRKRVKFSNMVEEQEIVSLEEDEQDCMNSTLEQETPEITCP